MKVSLWKRMLALLLIQSMLSVNLAYAGIWRREEEHWTYQENDTKITGWFNESGTNWYYFNQDGLMQTGWYVEDQQHRYYLNTATDGTEGLMHTGWFLQNGSWYFLSPIHDGFYGHAIVDCWQWIDGYCYLFDSNGVMYANCTTPDGYTVNQSGQWTVNGVVQYIAGKGILTKSISTDSNDTSYHSYTNNGDNNSSNGGGNLPSDSSGNTNTNIPSDGSDNPGTNPPSNGTDNTETNPPSNDSETPGTNQPPSDTGNTDSNPPSDDGNNTSGTENIGIITIKYMEADTDHILGEKTVTGKNGDIYIIQHPSIENYKILENQPDEAFFSQEEQTIEISYRPKQPDEAPDYSIVLPDHLKALVPSNAEEEAVIQSIYSECIAYNILDEESVEMAVTEDNPLLLLIKNGTYEKGDIIYIEPCDTFPIGLSLEYIEHNDSHSEPVDGYDSQKHEIIHARRLETLDLFEEGTYIEYSFKDITSENDIKVYTDLMDWTIDETPEKAVRKTRARQDSSNKTNGFEVELTLDSATMMKTRAKAKISYTNEKENVELKMPFTVDVKTNIRDIKIHHSLGGKDNRTLAQIVSQLTLTISPEFTFTAADFSLAEVIKSPNNKKKLGLLGIQLEGINLEDISLLGALVIDPFGKSISSKKVNNVISNYDEDNPSASNASSISISPVIAIFPTLTLTFSADGSINGEIVFETFIDIDTDRKDENIVKYYKDASYTKEGYRADGQFEFAMEKIEANWGSGLLAGVAIGGIMPIGVHLNGAFQCEGKANLSGKFDLLSDPKFTVDDLKVDTGISLTAGVYLDAAIRFTAKTGWFGAGVDMPEKRFILFEDLIYKYPFPSYSLKMGELFVAVDWKGKNISEQWKGVGYDPSINMVTTYEGPYGVSYKCPQYIKPLDSGDSIGNDNDNIYEVKTVRVLYSYEMLDISEAPGVEVVSISDDKKLSVFIGNGTAFPDSGTWYSDEEKKHPVSICKKGQIIYSEWYQPDLSGVQLYLINHTQEKAVSPSGTDVSNTYKGYNKTTGMVEPYFNEDDALPSFQCPYYIEDTDPLTYQPRFSKVASILVSDMFETLDISKAIGVQQVSISENGSLAIFIGNGKAFPSRGTWYSDKNKTIKVTSCKAGQTIYSEWYEPSSTLQTRQSAALSSIATPSNAAPRPQKEPADMPIATSSNISSIK